MGGYISVELLFPDEVSVFEVNGWRVTLTRVGTPGRMLPLRDEGAELTATPLSSGDGTSWNHGARIQLRSDLVTKQLDEELQTLHRRGCVLVGTTTNGKVKVFGSKEYPLLGTYHEEDAARRAGLHYHELDLSCICLHPALLV